MSYLKRGDPAETDKVKGKIWALNFKENKVDSVVIEVAEDSIDYYKGERVHVLVSALKS